MWNFECGMANAEFGIEKEKRNNSAIRIPKCEIDRL
jgi:hypothetical protein